MATEITSKSELANLTVKLSGESTELIDSNNDLKDSLSGISNYDGIDVASAASVLSNNLANVSKDLETVVNNIKNYVTQITGFDIDDFNVTDIEDYLSGVEGETITLPEGLGDVHSYMGWQCITATSSNQYKLREAAGMNFDSEGFAKIGDRYVVATTTTFGNVGDYIDVYQEDGSVIKCIIGDIKNQNDAGCTKWGHNNGDCVVEFVVDKDSWYGTDKTPNGLHPEWNQNITKIINKGNYFNLMDGKTSTTESAAASFDKSINKIAGATAATAAAAQTGASLSGYRNTSNNNYSGYSSSGESSSGGGYQRVSTTPVTITSGDPNIDVSKYHNNIEAGFEVTVGNLAYDLSDEDIELLCAIVAAESDKTYDDALAVITTILNRCEAPNWIRSHGTDPIAQATAPNQFVVYQHGSYKAYMNGKAPNTVKEAVADALAGVRNHKYLSFRSNGTTSYSNNMISPTGNRYK
ncbi:MAG: hypothetical protein ACI4XM_05010 [Candidatus Coprovivens sp.]